jgi:hypothetical protein
VTISTSSEYTVPAGVTISNFSVSAMVSAAPQLGLTSSIPPFM